MLVLLMWCMGLITVGEGLSTRTGLLGQTPHFTPSRLFGLLNDQVMTFGKRVDIQVALPSRDRLLVTEFLRDEMSLLSATWEKDKFTRITGPGSSRYLLFFPKLVLPGINTIAPEIEVEFRYIDGLVAMQSGNWTLRGDSGNVLKDSRFVESFKIVVQGQLGISSAISQEGQLATAPITLRGWVDYRVTGEKPSVFRTAPPFVLDVTIKLIQDTVSEFATSQFSTKFLRGFRKFVMQRTQRTTLSTLQSPSYDEKRGNG